MRQGLYIWRQGGLAMIRVVMATVILFAILVAVYLALDYYMRWARRRELETEHAEGTGSALTREDYVDRGMADYRRSWEKKLLIGVFAIPLIVIVLLAFLAS